MARNNTVTFGGKTPVELAMGRRPRDIITVEHEDPENLTTKQSQAESDVAKVQQLAMKVYLEARQHEDIRRGLAVRLSSIGGPFNVGDLVYLWQDDPSKIKRGKISGHWIANAASPVKQEPCASWTRAHSSSESTSPSCEWHRTTGLTLTSRWRTNLLTVSTFLKPFGLLTLVPWMYLSSTLSQCI